MRSVWNPRRFLSSIKPWFWGSPQPGKVFKQRMANLHFNSRNHARRKIHRPRLPILKSHMKGLYP